MTWGALQRTLFCAWAFWIPAFAGMTVGVIAKLGCQGHGQAYPCHWPREESTVLAGGNPACWLGFWILRCAQNDLGSVPTDPVLCLDFLDSGFRRNDGVGLLQSWDAKVTDRNVHATGQGRNLQFLPAAIRLAGWDFGFFAALRMTWGHSNGRCSVPGLSGFRLSPE